MTLFYAIAISLGLLALLFLLWPLWFGARSRAAVQSAEANVNVFRSRLADLEREQADGRISAEEAAALKLELQQSLLRDTEATEAASTAGRRPLVLLAVLLLVPVAVWLVYGQIGDPRAFDAEPEPLAASPEVQRMVTSLAERLKTNPDDLEGWKMLGRSYRVLERHADAASAYAQAYALTAGSDPEVLIDYAEAQALASEQGFSGRARQLLQSALKLNPDHRKGLWYAGIAAFDDGEYQTAINHWERLKAAEAPAAVLEALDRQIAEAREALGQPVDQSLETTNTANTAPADAGARLSVNVNVSAALREQISGQEVLLVYAKARSGPPVPLAIIRASASALPGAFELNDSQGMVAGMKLSSHDQWTIQARVTKSGQAMPQSGDFFGEAPAERGDEAVNVTIDQQVP